MAYLGGKHSLAKHIAPFLAEALTPGGRFLEPFVGGYNIVPTLRNLAPELPGQRIFCGDVHYGLIVLYRALRDGTFDPPSEMDEVTYLALKAKQDWSKPVTAFAAFGCSYMGMAFSTYAKDSNGTNYCLRARNSILKKRMSMGGVNFYWGSYAERTRPKKGDVIYADPPYINTAGYAGTQPIDHEAFYRWCEAAAGVGARVFVSEFTIPERPGWEVVWSTERKALNKVTKTDHLIEVKG